MTIFGRKINATDNTKIRMVGISKLRYDKDFKNVFQQETDKVTEISNDMKLNGFDKTRPIVVTETYTIVDGHSRFMAAKKAGLEKVPVIIKKFDSHDATIEYEYKMQLNSRRLSDGEYLAAFIKLDELRKANPKSQGSSDEAIGKQLNKSARQVCKMRELSKKASPQIIAKIKNGELSINKAYEIIKATESRTKEKEEIKTITVKKSIENIRINDDSFKLGILFVLSELNKGITQNQILNDKRISRFDLQDTLLNKVELKKYLRLLSTYLGKEKIR